MSDPIRVMVEAGKKKRVVACAFDWPGWDRSGKTEARALAVLAAYRPRHEKVAALAGLSDEFAATREFDVVERVPGNGMTDYYGVSGRAATPEQQQMTEAECERKIALLRASWTYFDDVGVRSSTDAWRDPDKLRAHRQALCAGISEFNARGPSAGSWWTVQFLIRRSAWHMLDHAWEMEDRDLPTGS